VVTGGARRLRNRKRSQLCDRQVEIYEAVEERRRQNFTSMLLSDVRYAMACSPSSSICPLSMFTSRPVIRCAGQQRRTASVPEARFLWEIVEPEWRRFCAGDKSCDHGERPPVAAL
jgi:hypothetical protein